jgi:alginate O-acetyltransferase complex protein AlgI
VAHLAARGDWQLGARRLPTPVLGFGYALAITLTVVLMPSAGKPFIYFQF